MIKLFIIPFSFKYSSMLSFLLCTILCMYVITIQIRHHLPRLDTVLSMWPECIFSKIPLRSQSPPPHCMRGVPSLTLKAPCINPCPTFTCCMQNDITTVLFCLSLCWKKFTRILLKLYIKSQTLHLETTA